MIRSSATHRNAAQSNLNATPEEMAGHPDLASAAVTTDCKRWVENNCFRVQTLANAINEQAADAEDAGAAKRFAIEILTMLMAPIAPHIAEEMWANLGHDKMLAHTAWPVADPALIAEDNVEIGVQVNGKLRDTVSLERDADEDTARAAALERPGVIRYLEGQSPKKVIVVKNRIINVVV